MELLLKNKVAIITGCDQGIGRAECKAFADAGAVVYANILKEDSAQALREDTESSIGSVEPVCFDITDETAAFALIKRIKNEQKKLDILVNLNYS